MVTDNCELECLVFQIFRICDQYVDIHDFEDFKKDFQSLLDTYDLDIEDIYYGKTPMPKTGNCTDFYFMNE